MVRIDAFSLGRIIPVLLCAAMIVPSLGALANHRIPSEDAALNSLGGLWGAGGPTESDTTHIIQPAAILEAHPGPLPSAVDNSAGLPPVGNQQSQGSCTCWAIGYYHVTFIENQESPFDLSDPANQASPAFLYNVANGGFNGGSFMEDVADLIISNGVPSMAEMPYDTADYTSWPADDWIWVSGMKRRASSQNWLYAGSASGQEALKAYLAAGNTATTGIDVWSNFDYIHNFNYTYCSSERYGTNRGGHIVTFCGYDDDRATADGRGAFRMVNSWGTSWGQAGYWWMSYEAVMDTLICYGWAMYLESLAGYSPGMAAKVSLDHEERGDIVSNQGLSVSVYNGCPAPQTKSFLCCPYIEDWYGGSSQQLPFPEGKMAFDISEFLDGMTQGIDHRCVVTVANNGALEGQLLSMEILNAEWWEGDLCWELPLNIRAFSTVQADTWVEPGLFRHLPLRIDSDADMAHAAIGEFWVGRGTASEPYLVHDYSIWGEGWGNCIYVGNTTSHFSIENCTLESASGLDWSDWHLDSGLFVFGSESCTVKGNAASSNMIGIIIMDSNGQEVSGNDASSNDYGIYLCECTGIAVSGNNMAENAVFGLALGMSSGNTIMHNTFSDNADQASDDLGPNAWDGGYPGGGNFWSDYSGQDMYYGPGQDQPGADGVGDSPYNDIQGDKSALDRYPLMSPGSPPQPPTFGIGLWPGWNFVSVPAEAADTSVEGVLASMSGSWDTVKYYDAGDASDPWKTFRPGGQSNDLDRIDRGMGFWVHATENCTLLTYDPAPGSTAIPLRAGWNMVGYPTLTERPVSDALWGTSADRVEVFDSASPELLREMAPTELMQPGMGYWVHVPVDSVWTIDW